MALMRVWPRHGSTDSRLWLGFYSQFYSNIPARLHIALTSFNYDVSMDLAFLNTLVNQYIRNRHTFKQALDRAVQPGRLRSTNALIRHEDKLWLVCNVNPDRKWLDFAPCCTGPEDKIISRSKRGKENLKCSACHKRADVFGYLKPMVLSAFVTEPVPHSSLVETAIGEWVILDLDRYGKHPLWKESASL